VTGLECRVLDIQGRDVTGRARLGPGVYFLREEGSRIQGFKGSSVRKVVAGR